MIHPFADCYWVVMQLCAETFLANSKIFTPYWSIWQEKLVILSLFQDVPRTNVDTLVPQADKSVFSSVGLGGSKKYATNQCSFLITYFSVLPNECIIWTVLLSTTVHPVTNEFTSCENHRNSNPSYCPLWIRFFQIVQMEETAASSTKWKPRPFLSGMFWQESKRCNYGIIDSSRKILLLSPAHDHQLIVPKFSGLSLSQFQNSQRVFIIRVSRWWR